MITGVVVGLSTLAENPLAEDTLTLVTVPPQVQALVTEYDESQDAAVVPLASTHVTIV